MRKSVLLVCMAVALLMSTACSRRMVYDKYVNTPLAGWEKNDTLTFNIPGMAAPGTYSQQVGLRMTSAFPFTSISLIVEQRIMPRGKVLTDTIKCPITDIRGNFLGDGISSFQYMFPLREVTLNKKDSIHVSIRHNMKREILPGVSDIGLKMEFK